MTTSDPLRSVVATMDRLRSPGGCPWDAEQTHESLLPFAIEEVYEVVEAIEHADRAGLREELGDLLLQVLFHARIAVEHPEDPFGIDDVAAGLEAKLRRRHPHVFAEQPTSAPTPEDVATSWDEIKAVEKARESVLDGVPAALPALARAQKVASRARRAGLEVAPPGPGAPSRSVDPAEELGQRLLTLVREAELAGVDAEGALRRSLRDWEHELRARERANPRVAAPDF